MIISSLFYCFSLILLLSAIMVITARNPVHSVLFLILCFFTSSGIFILLGAEFIAMIMVIVYVGAVAVLFLFVVMMLDISFSDLRTGLKMYVPLGILVGAIIMAELFLAYQSWSYSPILAQKLAASAPQSLAGLNDLSQPIMQDGVTNTHQLGAVIYTDYLLAFQLSGLVLLVAMIGAIVLTLRLRPDVRRQNIGKQVRTKPEDVLEIKKITSGSGV